MIEKLRALGEADKTERRNEILDAAERLFIGRSSGLASMDELAQASGIAKGTVYLYFPSKEEVLIALHERNAEALFDAIARRIEETPRCSFETLYDVVRRHIIESPSFLPVATLVVGYMERSVPIEAVIRFKSALGEKLLRVGTQVEQALNLPAGTGPTMLQYSFALIVGLWQITSCGRNSEISAASGPISGYVTDFPTEMRRALETLWRGAVQAPGTARTGSLGAGSRRVARTGARGRRTSRSDRS